MMVVIRSVIDHGNAPQHLPLALRQEKIALRVAEKWELAAVEVGFHLRKDRRDPQRIVTVEVESEINEQLDIAAAVSINFSNFHGVAFRWGKRIVLL